MTTPRQLRQAEAVELRLLQSQVGSKDADATDEADLPEDLLAVVAEVNTAAERWQGELAVSIGRARELTQLKETQIRYFEELEALQPAKSAETGASRSYSLAALRRLYALALLGKAGRRPAEAAALVRRYAHLVEQGKLGAISTLVDQESGLIDAGFLLARLASQLIDALQLELARALDLPGDGLQPRILELIIPLRPVFATAEPDAEEIERVGRALRRDPRELLLAVTRGDALAPTTPPALAETGRDDRTVLFYSPERHNLPRRDNCRFCVYIPCGQPQRAMLVVLDGGAAPLPHVMTIASPARALLLDRTLAAAEAAFGHLRGQTLMANYRYRSDGMPFEQTSRAYGAMLKLLLSVLLPDQDDAMAVLFIPDRLEQPTFLAALAECGYGSLAAQLKLDLRGEGQGLSGRAFRFREPFLSLNAERDARIAFGPEERCRSALAVPLVAGAGFAPFGVLYLASRRPGPVFESELAYVAVVLASILGELLGGWWLTRLRKERDHALHCQVDGIVRWIDGLDQRGPNLERAFDSLEALRAGLAEPEVARRTGGVALVVLDIDHYQERIQAQGSQALPPLAQAHVSQAIRKVLSDVEDFWFRNDHALLILEYTAPQQAVGVVRRIATQVRDVPPAIRDAQGKYVTITISAAIQLLSYQEFFDLGSGPLELRPQLEMIVDRLRQRTGATEDGSLQVYNAEPVEAL